MQYLFSRDADGLGRLVIPKEIRDEWGLTKTDRSVSRFMDDGKLVLMKQKPRDICVICGSQENLREVGPAMICQSCITIAAGYL